MANIIDVQWTSDQVRIILECFITRLEADPTLMIVEDKYNEIQFRNKLYDDKRISISIYKDSKSILLFVGEHFGRAELSIWWWKDKETKAMREKLLNYNVPKVALTSMDAIIKCFPETMNREFEKQVLEKK